LQLDTKIEGLPSEVLATALGQARDARLFILDKMAEAIAEPRAEMNEFAPRIESIEIPKDKIGEVIGPKGAVIRELEEVTGAAIEIEETDGKGIVRIASNDGTALASARERVRQIAFPPEVELGTAGVRRQGGQHHQVRRLRQHPSWARRTASHLPARRVEAGRECRGLSERWPGAEGQGP
jgi:polyribonucleotide nucleotidyltransferase